MLHFSGDGFGDSQGAVHMATARFGCKETMVGTRLANSHPGCTRGLRKCTSHLVGVNFWQGIKAVLNRYLLVIRTITIPSSLMSEHAMLQVCLLLLGLHLGSVCRI